MLPTAQHHVRAGRTATAAITRAEASDRRLQAWAGMLAAIASPMQATGACMPPLDIVAGAGNPPAGGRTPEGLQQQHLRQQQQQRMLRIATIQQRTIATSRQMLGTSPRSWERLETPLPEAPRAPPQSSSSSSSSSSRCQASATQMQTQREGRQQLLPGLHLWGDG